MTDTASDETLGEGLGGGSRGSGGEQLTDTTAQIASLSLWAGHSRYTGQDCEIRSKLVRDYVAAASPEFSRLDILRKKGWENPAGDAFFKQQRQNADNPDDQQTQAFYDMMKRIGREMQKCTGALRVKMGGWGKPQILDMGMAPGGFLATAMDLNPGAQAVGFSLPEAAGGHRVMLPDHPAVDRRDLDVTMLAADLGVADVPADHPDADKFLPRQFGPGQAFDLVVCGAGVVRKQARARYREGCEAHRLLASQLALGLERLRPGGTMVVLFHKVEAWGTALELYGFDQFARVRLFKPTAGHSKRSSFYMVATDVQSRHPRAVRSIARWKSIWEAATFRSESELLGVLYAGEPGAEELLEEFGEQLVRKGSKVWVIQAKALEHAPFIRGE